LFKALASPESDFDLIILYAMNVFIPLTNPAASLKLISDENAPVTSNAYDDENDEHGHAQPLPGSDGDMALAF